MSSVVLLCTHSSTSMSFLKRRAQNWTQDPRHGLTSGQYRGKITPLVLLVTLFLMLLAFLATWAHTSSCSTYCQPTPSGPFSLACFPTTLPKPAVLQGMLWLKCRSQQLGLVQLPLSDHPGVTLSHSHHLSWDQGPLTATHPTLIDQVSYQLDPKFLIAVSQVSMLRII